MLCYVSSIMVRLIVKPSVIPVHSFGGTFVFPWSGFTVFMKSDESMMQRCTEYSNSAISDIVY